MLETRQVPTQNNRLANDSGRIVLAISIEIASEIVFSFDLVSHVNLGIG